MPPLTIDVAERDGALVLTVEGELDIATARLLDEALARAAADHAGAVVVDLDQVEFIDSTGLQVLIKNAAPSGPVGQRLRLTKGSAQAQRLFEISGAIDRLPFID